MAARVAILLYQMDSALLKIRSVLPRDRQDYLDRLERSTAVVARGSNAIPRLSSEALLACSFEWLAGWVLSFGSMAEVLAPERLKEPVAAEAEKIAAKYTDARPLTSPLSASLRERRAYPAKVS